MVVLEEEGFAYTAEANYSDEDGCWGRHGGCRVVQWVVDED
jgi:hypothetical protein